MLCLGLCALTSSPVVYGCSMRNAPCGSGAFSFRVRDPHITVFFIVATWVFCHVSFRVLSTFTANGFAIESIGSSNLEGLSDGLRLAACPRLTLMGEGFFMLSSQPVGGFNAKNRGFSMFWKPSLFSLSFPPFISRLPVVRIMLWLVWLWLVV